MVAFWDGLLLRPAAAPAAARPFPAEADGAALPAWVHQLASRPAACVREEWDAQTVLAHAAEHSTPVMLQPLQPLWADVDELENARLGLELAKVGMPHYSSVFQGF
jgi:hypothetical protein